jgi:hypothetical protein
MQAGNYLEGLNRLKAFTGFKEPIVPSSMEIEVKCIP